MKMAIKLNKLINFDKAPRVKPTLNQKEENWKKMSGSQKFIKILRD